MSLEPGTRLGSYELHDRLGSGGMGEVWKAHDPKLQRTVAIKVLHARSDDGPREDAAARILAEARAASGLSHPNICTVHDVGEAGRQSFIVMEYVDGQPLSELIPSDGLPPETVIRYGTQIADALAHAHERGVVHRDLKSANVVISPEGQVKLIDFGIAVPLPRADVDVATMTQEPAMSGAPIGTLAYMAPEVLRGETSTPSSDVWSLGVLLYEMASGQLPFTGPTQTDVVSAIVKDSMAPLPARASTGLRGIVERCVVKEPGQRYRHASAVHAALEAISSPAPSTVQVASERQQPSSSAQPSLSVQPSSSATPSSVPSIAVLPFTDMSQQRDQEYFCEGIAEEIINALTGSGTLRVAARTSSFQAKAKGLDIAEVGARLNVETVLQGSLRKAGDQVRITAQLVNVADGYQMWSERFDRPLDDIFAVQDEIARAIGARLDVALASEAEAHSDPPTSDREAHEAQLKGRFLLTKDKLADALEQFEIAVRRDPRYAAAHSGLARTTAWLGDVGEIAPRVAAVRARAAAERALELDPSLIEAVETLAWVSMGLEWDFGSAERYFHQALAMDPAMADVHSTYGFFLFCVAGRTEDALAEVERAVELDPMSYFAHYWLAHVLVQVRPEEAIARIRETLELVPDNWVMHSTLGLALRLTSRLPEAIEAGRQAVRVSGRQPWTLAELGISHAAAGDTTQALALHEELTARARTGWGAPALHAALCGALGKVDQAFELLEQAFEARDVYCLFIRTAPQFDGVRDDPRFEDLVRRMRFPGALDAT